MKFYISILVLSVLATLGAADITEAQAKKACATLRDPGDRKNCIFDVLATQDIDMAEAY
jgi:uncharacterized protein YecT (DUF1311 family)